MITTEVRINGALIGHLYAHNEGLVSDLEAEVPKSLEGSYLYYYEWYQPKKETILGRITHKREDGAEVLIAKIFNTICLDHSTK